jgi:hypothetical protein
LRIKGLSLLPVLVTAAGMAVLPASGASAATTPVTTSLPITSFYQVVTDTAHNHLFVSEGDRLDYSATGGSGAILVTGLDGTAVKTISGLSGVRGLALSPDGATLYAAVTGANEIVAISTSTLQTTATYTLGTGYNPYNLAFEDGLLWVSYGAANSATSGIGYIDPGAASPVLVPGVLNDLWTQPPYISADPARASTSSGTGAIVASETSVTPTPVASFEISGGTVTSSDTASISGLDPERALEVLPGGSQFVLGAQTYNTTDLGAGPQSTYPVPDGGVSAYAVASKGMVAVGYGTNSSGNAGIVTFPSGSTTPAPANGYGEMGDKYSYVAGMDWSAESSELFSIVTKDDSSGNITGYTLQTLYPPAPWEPPQPLSLAISASTVGYKGTVTVSASVGITNDSSMHTVNIYETPAGGQPKLIETTTLGSGNGISVTSPQLTTSTSFTASVDGDSEYSGTTTAAQTVGVYAGVQEAISGYYGSLTLSEPYKLFHHTGTLRVNTTVFPSKSGECVRFEFQHNNGKAWVPLTTTGCAGLSSTSKFAITRAMSGYLMNNKYRVRVDFIPSAKDTANLAADSGWLYFIDAN